MTITVYGKAKGCPQCDATKRRLNKQGTPFTYVDVDTDQDALNYVLSLGYQQVPVVEHEGGHWSGYNPPKLQGLANARKDAA